MPYAVALMKSEVLDAVKLLAILRKLSVFDVHRALRQSWWLLTAWRYGGVIGTLLVHLTAPIMRI